MAKHTAAERSFIAWTVSLGVYVGSYETVLPMFDAGHFNFIINQLIATGPPDLLVYNRDPWMQFGMMLSVLCKLCSKLTPDRLCTLHDAKMAKYLTACCRTIANTPVADISPRGAVMAMLMVLNFAKNPVQKHLIIDEGILGVLALLLDVTVADCGREVGILAACSGALLAGREEVSNFGLNEKAIEKVCKCILTMLNSTSTDPNALTTTNPAEFLAAAQEIIISDRHLKMMLDAGILKAFALIAEDGFDEWMLTVVPGKPVDGKYFNAKAWETVALIGLNAALMPEGKAMLQNDDVAMRCLRMLAGFKDRADLHQAQKDAKLALFELSGTSLHSSIEHTPASGGSGSICAESSAGDGGGSGNGQQGGASPTDEQKHVMVSYSWAQQDVVLRLVAALKARGYNVWVDVESMRGSTIDAMALAVEQSAVVCVCMSKEYKESVNCRFEANYVVQQRVPYVCLMLQENYQPNGWLGMMQGTHLYYEMHGDTLRDETAFEGTLERLTLAIDCHLPPAHSTQPVLSRPTPAAAAAPPAASTAAEPSSVAAFSASRSAGAGRNSGARRGNQQDGGTATQTGGGAGRGGRAGAAAAREVEAPSPARRSEEEDPSPHQTAETTAAEEATNVDVNSQFANLRVDLEAEVGWLQGLHARLGVAADATNDAVSAQLERYLQSHAAVRLKGMQQDGVLTKDQLNSQLQQLQLHARPAVFPSSGPPPRASNELGACALGAALGMLAAVVLAHVRAK